MNEINSGATADKRMKHRKLTSKLHEQTLRQLESKKESILKEREKYQKKIDTLNKDLERYQKTETVLRKKYEKARDKEKEVEALENAYYQEMERIRKRKNGVDFVTEDTTNKEEIESTSELSDDTQLEEG